jgi:hypothetical protein
MRIRRTLARRTLALALALAIFFTVLILPTSAYAQDATNGLPPVSLPIAVTTIVSIVLGVVNMIAQGSILNLVAVPKNWAGPATIGATFLTGVGSFLASASQPWTGSTAFYAFAFGLFGLFGGGLPAFAVHAHTTVPKMMRAARKGILPVLLLVGCAGLAASQPGCNHAAQATIDKVDQIIERDIAAGKSLHEIEADVNALLGKPAVDVETIVMDIITTILDVGGLTSDKADHAQAILGEIRAKKGLSAPTHVLRAIPAGAAPAP